MRGSLNTTAAAESAKTRVKAVMRRSPNKKTMETGTMPPPAGITTTTDNDAVPFNPLVAMQTVIAGDMVSIKQRAKAAQQLASFFSESPTTPSLYAYYEAYLPIIANVIVAPIKAAKEVQENAIKMMKALGAHCPRQFVNWCALHVTMHVSTEPWHVEWCYGMTVAAEARVPRLPPAPGQVGDASGVWDRRSIEYQEMDGAIASLFHLWRTMLDTLDDEATVVEIARNIKSLLTYEAVGDENTWRELVTSKLQPHFVDIADVLIGWAISSTTSSALRDMIVGLIRELRELWARNNVFSLQLLRSFTSDIATMYATPTQIEDDQARLDSVVLCSVLVAESVPSVALNRIGGEPGFLEQLLRSVSMPGASHPLESSTVHQLAQYLLAISATQAERFAPLSMSAVQFLVGQVASAINTHRGDNYDCLMVLEAAARIGKTCLPSTIEDSTAIQNAKQFLSDKRSDSSGSVIDTLFEFGYLGAAKHFVIVVTTTTLIVGYEGLQMLAELIRRRLQQRQRRSVTLLTTCLILAARDPVLTTRSPHEHSVVCSSLQCLTEVIKMEAEGDDVATFRALQKAVLAYGTAIRKHFGEDADIRSHEAELMSELARGTIRHVRRPDSRTEDVQEQLRVITWTISALSAASVSTTDVMERLLDAVQYQLRTDAKSLSKEVAVLLGAVLQREELSDAHRRQVLHLGLETLGQDFTGQGSKLLLTKVFPQLVPSSLESSPASDGETTNATWKNVWAASEMSIGDFECVFELLSDPSSSEDTWLNACHRYQRRVGHLKLAQFTTIAQIKHFVREAAKWIVQNRLRSPLGPPSAIFSAVERMAQTQAAVCHHVEASADQFEGISAAMLIEFVLAMEALLTIVIDVDGPDSSNAESDGHKMQTFFRANVAVCDEWLSRVRPMVTQIASTLRQSEAYAHLTQATLVSVARKVEGFAQKLPSSSVSDEVRTRVIKTLADAELAVFGHAMSSCEMGDADTVLGLHEWWKSRFSRVSQALHSTVRSPTQNQWQEPTLSPWLRGFGLEAETRYEDAVVCYEALTRHAMAVILHRSFDQASLTHPLNPLGMSFELLVKCIRRCGQCYAKLRRWGDLHLLQSRCHQFLEACSSIYDVSSLPFSRLSQLCDVWQAEHQIITHGISGMNGDVSYASSAARVDTQTASASAAALAQWGCLDDIDRHLHASAQAIPDQLAATFVMNQLRLLRFRSAFAFADSRSPTSVREQVSAVVNAAMLHPATAIVRRTAPSGLEDMVDPTLWSKLNVVSREQRYTDDADGQVDWFLSVARSARKQKNFVFAQHLLDEMRAAYGGALDGRYDLMYENSALMLDGEASRDGFQALLTICSSVLRNSSLGIQVGPMEAVVGRAFGRLAKTMSHLHGEHQIATVELAWNALGASLPRPSSTNVEDYRDELAKLCLKSATHISPSSPRSWYEYSSWLHQQGRRAIESACASGGRIALLQTEDEALSAQLRSLGSVPGAVVRGENVRDALCRLIDERGALLRDREQKLYEAVSQGTRLVEVEASIQELISLQARIVARVMEPFKQAVAGYKAFLITAETPGSTNVDDPQNRARLTSVCLRLLRMLTRFGADKEVVASVVDVLESGPLAPWSTIVPQLLSRIGHADPAVSRPVAELLARIAQHTPHLVVYPAIVEYNRVNSGGATSTAAERLRIVIAALEERAPEMTDSVQKLVRELNRIAVLWDDAWVWTLMKMAGDVNRRLGTLQKEAQRVEKNSSLSVDEKTQLANRKAIAIMTPVLISIEKLWGETVGRSVPGEMLTPHEQSFINKYGATISTAMAAFKRYCHQTQQPRKDQDVASPSAAWEPFAELLQTLLGAVGKRERVDLAEISPILARIGHKHKTVVMPGVASSSHSSAIVNVSEVSRNVAILRTKTKPKCLKFTGSDGSSHRYLLKAREDLHLDERMMQFLRTVNGFLQGDRFSSMRNLRARNYGVVPLSSDAGLIHMVPDVLALFQIYNSRVDNDPHASAAAQAGDPETPAQPMQQPPTAPFYSKLKQYGIQDVSPSHRARWPLSILRRVHEDLVASRPVNAINRELTMQSLNFADAQAKRYRFNRSTAVMSVLGYLVGLGDRHLDNMLLCTQTGELLHIDYNVCFDKGKKLKVPEVVPFRLTPIMVDGLGLTGVDGMFRTAFANTLRVVRHADSREALLALLEAFVYDPLADWVAMQPVSRDSKQRMDVNVNLSLFLSRARERWQETTAFLETFSTATSGVTRSLAAVKKWANGALQDQWRVVRNAVETEKRACEDVRQAQENWELANAAQPNDQSELLRINDALEHEKTQVQAFVAECWSRHSQLRELKSKVEAKTLVGTPYAASALVGKLTGAYNRLLSIVLRMPPSHATQMWSTMLAGLEARCVGLDQQLPALVDQTGHIIRELAPMLSQYKHQRLGGEIGDSFADWHQKCARVMALMSENEKAGARELIQLLIARSHGSLCSRDRHTSLASQLKSQLDRAAAAGATRVSHESMESIIQRFSSQLTALKLSNSQTQRVIKLLCCRWMIERIKEGKNPMRQAEELLRVCAFAHEVGSASKGAVKKLLTDAVTKEFFSSNGVVLAAVAAVKAVADSANRLRSAANEAIQRAHFSTTASTSFSAFDQAISEIGDRVAALNLACESLQCPQLSASSMTEAVQSIVQRLAVPSHEFSIDSSSDLIAETLATFASETLVPTIEHIIRHVVVTDWRLGTAVLDSGVDHIDTLVVESMPSVGAQQAPPLTGFHALSDSFTALWSTWGSVSAMADEQAASSGNEELLTSLLREHEQHLEYLGWTTPGGLDGRSPLCRGDLLARIGHFAPAFPMIYEGVGRVESNLLEVAQQLEYVASQISFNSIGGLTSFDVEAELRAVSNEVQDVYHHVSRHFELVREVADVAVAVNALEVSSKPLCAQDTDAESEVDQVARTLLRSIGSHLDRLIAIENERSNNLTMVQLSHQLAQAQAMSATATEELRNQQAVMDELCARVSAKEVTALVSQVRQDVTALVEAMHSLGVQPEALETSGSGEPSRRAGSVTVASRFMFAENERLLRILHRSVAAVQFMQELHILLQDHEKQHALLIEMAAALANALQAFGSIVQGPETTKSTSRDARALLALLDTTAKTDRDGGDLVTAMHTLVQTCSRYFFDAAQLADQLTKTDNIAAPETTEHHQRADDAEDTGDSEDAGEEDGDSDSEGSPPVLDKQQQPTVTVAEATSSTSEQNRYAVEVVARIDDKLSGIVVESGTATPLSVEDQSSWLIQAATNVDNLCVMYEGWTPWI